MTKDFDTLKQKVFQNLNIENKLNTNNDLQYSVRSFSKEINWPLPYDTTINETNEYQIFQYIVYELQKMSVQKSYSMICLVFLRISDYLTNTISALKNISMAGADETFNVLIYIICSARISNFLSNFEFVEKFCPSFMIESKIGYLIEQTKSSIEFINSFVISCENDKSKSMIIFPFLFQGGATKVLLDETKLEIVLYPNESIPAVFKLLEKQNIDSSSNNKVIGYLQEFDRETFNQFRDIRLINTTEGLLPLHLGKQNYQKINDNDYEKYIASMM